MKGYPATAAEPLRREHEVEFVRTNLPLKYRQIFNIQLAFGLRVIDATRLTIEAVERSLQTNKLAYVEKKTGQSRQIKLTPRKREVLSQALKRALGRKYLTYLFEGDARNCKPGRHITTRAVAHHMERVRILWLRKFGHDKVISTHTARKTYACLLYEKTGKNIAMVSEAIGHKSVKVTEKYISSERKYVEEAQAMIDDWL